MAQMEVNFAKTFFPPGHPKLVAAQETLRSAQSAAFSQRPLDQQARSLQDRLKAHADRMRTQLEEMAAIEAAVRTQCQRHQQITADIQATQTEVADLESQLAVINRALASQL